MHYSIPILALMGTSSVLAVRFGGRTLPDCSDACFKDVLGRPGLRECKNDELCLCQDHAILNAMQDCMSSKDECNAGRDRVLTIYDLQDACDAILLEAAPPLPSESGEEDPKPSQTPIKDGELPEPTSLEEAEARLGPSAVAFLNEKPFQLSTGQKAGIAIGSVAAFLVLCAVGFCCGVFHYKNYVIKKMNEDIQKSPATRFPGDEEDLKRTSKSSWFTSSTGFKTHSRGTTFDSHELGYGLDKELGLMISGPTNPRKFTTTKIRTVDIPESEHTLPRAPPPAASPHRSPTSPQTSPSRTMSLGSVMAPQRPSLTLSSPTLILPQATIDDYTPRNSFRVSVQSAHQRPPTGPNINIPLMFFTPATPQIVQSPISPTENSENSEIYGYYSRDSVRDSMSQGDAIGVARTSLDERAVPSTTAYDPTNNDSNYVTSARRTPSPAAYNPNASQGSPYNNYSAATPEPRGATPGYDMYTDVSSRISSPSPQPAVGAGLQMAPRHTPYTPPQYAHSASPSPTPSSASSNGPPVPPKILPEMVDLSQMPATINRANSLAWRLSVERAADKAMDKVRVATGHSEMDEVPEEEERLTKSDLPNTQEDSGRGRKKNRRNYSQSSINYSVGGAQSKANRSGSIGASRSPSGTRGVRNSNSGYARRSTSLGGYRNRTGSMNYNQMEAMPRVPRRNSRRGSNSSSVMMV